ncbi:MAG: DUF523 domain-containing protein [Deltaproteobacteria bacterium]|nr:DUF523 domain-containing protein [Deltaproteobacteria bacterium]
MKLALHPGAVAALREPTEADPWRLLVSACLTGAPCGVDGDDYGMGAKNAELLALPTLKVIPFCPEDHGLGTPRTMPDLHGGDGRAFHAGRARVLDQHGQDLSEGMRRGAEAMRDLALREEAELALLTDASAACGTQVISLGCRFDTPRRFQFGFGVAAALLVEAGIPVVSNRDFATLGRLRARLQPGFVPDPEAKDHHDHPWVVEHRSEILSHE